MSRDKQKQGDLNLAYRRLRGAAREGLRTSTILSALFAQTQSLIILLLLHFLIFLLEISKLAFQLNLAAI